MRPLVASLTPTFLEVKPTWKLLISIKHIFLQHSLMSLCDAYDTHGPSPLFLSPSETPNTSSAEEAGYYTVP